MKNKLKVLKAQKTRLLNKKCETEEEFEKTQDRLNEVEFEMMIVQNEEHIPYIN